MSKTFTKNIPVNEILHLGEHLEYKEGQVISITIAQNERLSITLFALPKGEEISTHVTVGDAIVQILDGEAHIEDLYNRIAYCYMRRRCDCTNPRWRSAHRCW